MDSKKNSMPKTDAIVYESPVLDGVGLWVENRVKPIQSSKTNERLLWMMESWQIRISTDLEMF